MSLSIAEVILEASQILRKAGVPEPRREAGSLLAFVSGRDRTFLIAHAEHVLSQSELNDFRQVVERRATGEPQQYITGVQDFFNREFKVTPDVLIPRPETELLVEAALKVIEPEREANVCDVGTGSGCIAVSLLCERRLARVTALDISESALAIAKLNAQAYDVTDRITLLVSDCFDSVPSVSRFDLVVTNPPYVSAGALSGLQREVKDHEPLVALSPGDDGLVVIRRLLGDAPRFLKPGGHLIMEIGFDQSEKLRTMIQPDVWQLIDILPDLQGIPRIAVLSKQL